MDFAQTSFPLMVFWAFLGGIILNAMPCVFPMLAIKLLSVLKSADHSPIKIRASGIAYALGVISTFLIFGGIIIAVKMTGKSIGWGFQLQNPTFILSLVILFVLIGFNFLGSFEVSVPAGWLPAGLQNKQGIMGEFWAGALVAIVATPCSAPFMASAMGYALSQSAVVIVIIFTSLGLGLSMPFLFLTFFPALADKLPRPGQWMVILKEVFAFPMFATSTWLIWVYGQQKGIDGVVWLLAGLVGLAMFVWAKSSMHLQRRGKIILGAVGLVFFAWGLQTSMAQKPVVKSSAGSHVDEKGIEWIDFSEEKVQELVDSGRKVFVDYTAAWCVSCKANEKVVFSSDLVLQTLKDQNVALVKADWTNEDDAITDSLEKFGRSGVPLYLMYGGEHKEKPLILPQLLTPTIFLDFLGKLD